MNMDKLKKAATLLVEPETMSPVRLEDGKLICDNGHSYVATGNVVCFLDAPLTQSQQVELAFTKLWAKQARAGAFPELDVSRIADQCETCWKWTKPWISHVTEDTSIVCLGSSIADDLPHIKNSIKISIDHLAHEYIKFMPEMQDAATVYVSANTSHLPFKDNSIDIVYTRNAVDHFDNPVKSVMEAARILKPNGRLMLAVYYNSSFLSDHESFVVNEEFISRVVSPLFDIEHRHIETVPKQFTINNAQTGFIHISAIKKPDASPLSFSEQDHVSIEQTALLFHRGFSFQGQGKMEEACESYSKLLTFNPVFDFEIQRIIYAAIYLSSIKYPGVFKAIVTRLAPVSPTWMRLISSVAQSVGISSVSVLPHAPDDRQFDIPTIISGEKLYEYVEKMHSEAMAANSAPLLEKASANT